MLCFEQTEKQLESMQMMMMFVGAGTLWKWAVFPLTFWRNMLPRRWLDSPLSHDASTHRQDQL
jgi:hypothetical protein